MRKHIRNLFITAVSLVGLTYLYRRYMRRTGPLVRIVVFHDIPDAVWFRNVIQYIDAAYNIVSVDDFMASRFDFEKINVLITFDDGYRSWVDVGVPVLEEYGIKALFFVNSGLVDAYDQPFEQKRYVTEQLCLSPRMTISWDGVQELLKAGHTIGGHTVTHARLSLLQRDMQLQEIEADKKRIETMTQQQVTVFAYPFGQRTDITPVTEECVEGSGYTHAFTTEGVFLNHSHAFKLSRLCFEDGMPLTRVGEWIEGGYDVYHICKKICVR